MATSEKMREHFNGVGRHAVERQLNAHQLNLDWSREAVKWLAEQDAVQEAARKAEADATLRYAKSAALAGWLALAATILFGIIQLAG